MKNQTINSVKLGIFVLAAIAVLILSLYLIGKNRSWFGAYFEIKTHFRTVGGLAVGNNVRYAGIDVGTVKKVLFVNDTTVEVVINLDMKMKEIIRKNALAALGTDGLIGNRVINISAGSGQAPFVEVGTVISSKEEINTDKMLNTLGKTNDNIALISAELLNTLRRINTSAQVTSILDDVSLSNDLKASLNNLRETTQKASALMSEASRTLALASTGEGTLATILTDTTLAGELRQAVGQIKTVENSMTNLVGQIDQLAQSVEDDLAHGKGPANAILKDSTMANNLRQTIENLERGTASFNENMEALKHNFLFRRYFKKQEKQNNLELEKNPK